MTEEVEPVRSDSTFGRYYRPLLPGTYTFKFSYVDHDDIIVENVVVTDSVQTELNVSFASIYFVEDIVITIEGNTVELNWGDEQNYEFEVYSSTSPYDGYSPDLEGNYIDSTTWEKDVSDQREFFKVRKIPTF